MEGKDTLINIYIYIYIYIYTLIFIYILYKHGDPFVTNSTTTDESLLACLLAEFPGMETGDDDTITNESHYRVLLLLLREE